MRYYWWCVQCAALVILPMVAKRYDMNAVMYCLKHAVDWRYVYDERHGWESIDEPISAVDLIMRMRAERTQRERAIFLSSFEGPPVSDSGFRLDIKREYVTALSDRDTDAWAHLRPATVRATASVPRPRSLGDPYWHGQEVDTVLMFPEVWPDAIEQREKVNA